MFVFLGLLNLKWILIVSVWIAVATWLYTSQRKDNRVSLEQIGAFKSTVIFLCWPLWLLVVWAMCPAERYHFWMPQSGFTGGLVFGTIVTYLLFFAPH